MSLGDEKDAADTEPAPPMPPPEWVERVRGAVDLAAEGATNDEIVIVERRRLHPAVVRLAPFAELTPGMDAALVRVGLPLTPPRFPQRLLVAVDFGGAIACVLLLQPRPGRSIA